MEARNKYEINPKDLEINWMFFEKILEANDFTKMDMMQVCSKIYEATYMYYGMKFIEERNRSTDYHNTIVSKVGLIDEKDNQIKALEKACLAAGVSLPTSSDKQAEEDTGSVLLQEGSDGDKGDS